MKNTLIAILLVAVSVETYFLVSKPTKTNTTNSSYTEKKISDSGSHNLTTENQKLRSRIEILSTDLNVPVTIVESPKNQQLETAQILTDLSNNGLIHLRFSFLDPSGKLSPKLAKLFGLTFTEVLNMQSSIEVAQRRLAETTKANSTLSRSEDGGITINTAPFLETGNAIYQTLVTNIAQTIGEQRSTALMQLMGDKMEQSLGYFGAEERTIEVRRVPSQNGEGSYFTLQESRSWGDGHSGHHNNDYESLEALTQSNPDIADMIPKDL